MTTFSLGCGSSPVVRFTATSPTDAYFIVEASARWHVEAPGLLRDLLLLERKGESISVEQAPFDEGRCDLRALGAELFLVCTNATEEFRVNELRFARRTDGIWHTEILQPATPETAVLGFEVAPDGSVYIATQEGSAGMRKLFVAAREGDFEVETLAGLPNSEVAVMALDGAAEPVWAAWTHPDFYRLSYTDSGGTAVELVSQGLELASLRLTPFEGENEPLIVTTVESVNSAFVPSARGFTRVPLTPPSTETYDCPTDETDCTGVDRICTLNFESYSPPVVATSTTHGTFIAYDHEVGSSTSHQYDCQANCSCTSTANYESAREFVLARLDGSGEPAVLERLSLLPRPVALAATDDTVHVLGGDGNSYFTLAEAER